MMRRWTTVRPVHEQWPHRPLIGEDVGFSMKEENGDGSPSDKPLLPVVTVPAQHVRQGSKGEGKGKPWNPSFKKTEWKFFVIAGVGNARNGKR
eukprot:jgi/Picre1/28983/NNA_004377.t1